MVAVLVAAILLHLLVLGVAPRNLEARTFIDPVVVAIFFSLLLIRLRRHVLQERVLRQALQRREAELRHLNRDLEATVAARTAELRDSHVALLHAQKMDAIGSMASGIAHDFNNLLTVMFSAAEELHQGGQDAAQTRELGDELLMACTRARDLTRKLTIFSRKEPQKTSLVDPNHVIKQLAPFCNRLLGEDLVLMTDLAADGLTWCDPVHLEQAALNLMINARDAGAKRITLRTGTMPTARAPRYARELDAAELLSILVEDDGSGMDAEIRARALEPFFTTKPVGRGTGLGLSTTYAMVRAAGGALVIDSVLGKGTTVGIYLPRAIDRLDVEAAPGVASTNAIAGDGRLILLLENQDQIRRLISRTLMGCGFEVRDASTVPEMEALIARYGEDAAMLLSDLRVPGGSGYEVARQFAAKAAARPVLLMTGYAEPDPARASGHALLPILQKPFTSGELLLEVDRALAGSPGAFDPRRSRPTTPPAA